jgi:potassium efflux system protein
MVFMSFNLPYSKIIFEYLPLHKITFIFFFTVALLGNFENSYGQDIKNTSSSNEQAEAQLVSVPDLSEIIPLAAEIEGKLFIVQNALYDTIDKGALETKYKEIEENLNSLELTLVQMDSSESTGFMALSSIKKKLLQVAQDLEDVNKPLSSTIKKIEADRSEWLEDRKNWSKWDTLLVTDNTPKQISNAFNNTQSNINTALDILFPKLEALLQIQERGYSIEPKINMLTDKIGSINREQVQKVLIDESPPLFSGQYLNQFSPLLWTNIKNGMNALARPDNFRWIAYFWLIIFEFFLFIGFFMIIKKNYNSLQKSVNYKFLANHAMAAALFFSVATIFLIFIDEDIPSIIKISTMMIIGVSFCALVSNLIQTWMKNLIYFFTAIVICTQFLLEINFPFPLFRLYVALISLIIVILLVYRIKQGIDEKSPKYLTYILSVFALYFGVVFIAEVAGKEVLALFLFGSLIRSIVQIALFGIYIFIIRGALEWLLLKLTYKQGHVNPENISTSANRLSVFINILGLVFLIIPEILITWGVFSSMKEANDKLMSIGFTLGSAHITLQIIITAFCVLYGSYILSTIISRLIMDDALDKKNFDKGTRLSIAQLVHYLIMFIGFIVAISFLGFDLTSFTIILSALGVGIGFGLQGLVNNFVSGLILLFEQPIREGDSIEAPGTPWSTVKKIGLRATRLTTYEQGDLIVPNYELTSKNVTNWTLNNKLRNLILPIGVSYGSDIPLVMKTLMDAGKANEYLVKNSVPVVLFRSFGDSVLNLELRVLVKDANRGLSITSAIYQDIYQRFDKANIKIAYPQLDVHLYNATRSKVQNSNPEIRDN